MNYELELLKKKLHLNLFKMLNFNKNKYTTNHKSSVKYNYFK